MHRVDVVEPGADARCGHVACEIGTNLVFDTSGLEAYCFANWDARVYDAMLVAGAVQFCDQTKRRRAGGWGRHFQLGVPVHDVGLWRSAAVARSLEDLLSFVTGDRWEIEFRARRRMEPAPAQGQFKLPDGERIIVPFSDGLDSLSVAGLAAREHGDKVVRVRLGPRSAGRRTAVGRQVPFVSVPYSVHCGNGAAVEPSARSRGFRFALLTGLASYLSQAQRVIVTESGQGALGPVLVAVGQGYEDYRNHPLFTDRMARFIEALLEHKVDYQYPRIWHTKAQTLTEYVSGGEVGSEWKRTRSCWQSQRHMSFSRVHRQCGVCAACLLRRMSVHASRLEENVETYMWEDLNAERFEQGAVPGFRKAQPRGAQYKNAIGGVLHLDHLAGLLSSKANRIPVERQVRQLSGAMSVPVPEIKDKLDRLLGQHAEEWRAFLRSLDAGSFVRKWALGDR